MPDYGPDLRRRARQAQAWMYDASLPFWAARAQHAECGFHEALALTGDPIVSPSSRVRVQARQTFCFAVALDLGWSPDTSRELCRYGIDVLQNHCRREDGLFGTLVSHSGGLADPTAQLYDSAFARLAFASAVTAGIADASTALRSTCRAIEQHLKRPPAQNGYAETLPTPDDRNQNPHMHLYEAAIGHYLAGYQPAIDQAYALENLLTSRFYDPKLSGLRERFATDWGHHPGDHFEAGHQYEWVWLLHRRARADNKPVNEISAKLYQKALSLTGDEGQIWLKHTHQGEILDGTQRSWALTEALKAHLVRFEAGDVDAAKRAVETYDRLWHLHIVPAIEGGWIDKYDRHDTPISEDIPASIGYHMYLAFSELMRLAKRLDT